MPPPDDAAVHAFRRVLLLAQQLRYLYDRRLQDDGLTTAQATALTFADQHPDAPLSYTQLGDLMATSHQNVAQVVAALERRGFAEVRVDPRDGRVRRVHVTEESRRYWAGRDEDDVAWLRSLFSPLGPGGLQELNGVLDRLQDHIHEVYRHERRPSG